MCLVHLSLLLLVLTASAITSLSVAENCEDASDTKQSGRMDRVETLLLRLDQRLQQVENENQQLKHDVTTLKDENTELRDLVLLLLALKGQNHDGQIHASKLSALNQLLQGGASVLNEKVMIEEKGASKLTSSKAQRDRRAETDHVMLPRDVSARSDDAGPLEPVVNHLTQQLTEVSAEVQALKTSNAAQIQELKNSYNAQIQALQNANVQQDVAIQEAGSSVYVRWGRSVCPNSTHLVYSGVVGGSWFDHTGAATNYLCLSLSPIFSGHVVPGVKAYLYGGEYETDDHGTNDVHEDKDPVCAVCRSQHPTTVMVPGTNVCWTGWSLEYSGYLMAGRHDQTAGSEYVCVDSALEDRVGSNQGQDGVLMYLTVTQCGSLPCDPYVDNKVVTCAVCSQ